MAEETDLATKQGAPWGKPKYGDPGTYTANQDIAGQPGIMSSPIYQQFLASVSANRAATDKGTQAQLGAQNPQFDPYAAQRENSQLGLNSRISEGDYQDRLAANERENQMKMQKYLQDLHDYQLEEARRNEYWDKAGRTAYGGGKLITSYYTGGAAGKKKSDSVGKDPMLTDDYSTPNPSADLGYDPGYKKRSY